MTAWNDRRVLITGAGGFIGSHLTERLVELGASVRAFVHYRGDGSWGWLDHSPVKAAIEVVAGDVCDRDSVRQAIRDADVVFHLAALIAIPFSYHAPAAFVRTNIEGTLNVLQAAREAKITRLIHTSTSEVYGTAQHVPITEQHPLHAQSPYAASKVGADQLVQAFHSSFGLPVVTVRPFNTFGPRQSARAVIPTIIAQCLTSDVVHLGNLSPSRDLNYVTNTVEGFVRAAESEEAIGRTINLGSGREIAIGALAELVAELLGKSVRLVQASQRVRPTASEVERLLADTTVAKHVLGWEPSVSLEEGLKFTIEWMQEHLDGYRPGVYAV